MGEIFVLVEHRRGEVRDITFEMLSKANELCRNFSHNLSAIFLGGEDMKGVDDIVSRADRVIAFRDARLKDFNSEHYKSILYRLIQEHSPFLTLIGHTSWGINVAPALSVKTGYPLATDCVDILVENDRPAVIRQIYSGKVFSKVSFSESKGYLLTVRSGAFTPSETLEDHHGELVSMEFPADLPESARQFVEFVDSGAGAVDISQADILVSVGRGIGEKENIDVINELADLMGGVVSCSRPIVDKNWLPKYHQVGTSGKTVRPKVYLAFGISGAFQHMAGVTGAGAVIAVNKDKRAPIFRVADYGVVDDLFNIVSALKEKLGS
ncbi:MAG: electron transfer flavoprotein subunit alpha/FixB family protein [Thermodesulfobacteriota bacterium]|nr:electron transfer flavoprotein subunit alpha/FixB family protein [Thermodesulfobacteriota bacterium]